MSDQAIKDWEEYQVGLQGTMTGSMTNQLGLNDRPQSFNDTNYSKPTPTKNKPTRAKTLSKTKQNQSVRTVSNPDHNGLSYLIATIAGLTAFILLLPEIGEESIVTYILAGGVAVLAQRYYKIILAVVIIITSMYIFN